MTTATLKDNSFVDLINALSRAFIREFNTRLATHQVTYAQWRFLLLLWEQDGMTQKLLSQKAGIEPATTVRTLDRMERDSLITRNRSAKDRREININLTDKGKSLSPILTPIHSELEKQITDGLSKEELTSFNRVLAHVLQQIPPR